MKLFFAAFLTVFAGAASAQELKYSDDMTRFCLDTAQTDQGRQSCIGKSAAACMSTPEGGSTVGMGGCIDRELEFWDQMLNDNYQTRMVEAKKADVDAAAYQPNLPSQADALRDMQRAWITYRDAACSYERSQWGGGTGGGPATLGCLMRLTGQQALSLAPRTF